DYVRLILLRWSCVPLFLLSFPTRRSSDLPPAKAGLLAEPLEQLDQRQEQRDHDRPDDEPEEHDHDRLQQRDQRLHQRVDLLVVRSEEHTSELQSLAYLVCRLLLEKKKHII